MLDPSQVPDDTNNIMEWNPNQPSTSTAYGGIPFATDGSFLPSRQGNRRPDPKACFPTEEMPSTSKGAESTASKRKRHSASKQDVKADPNTSIEARPSTSRGLPTTESSTPSKDSKKENKQGNKSES